MRSRRRTWAFVLIYVVFMALVLEGGAYVVLRLWDNELGDRPERHLYNPIRGHELNPRYRRSFDTDGVEIHSEQGFRREGTVEIPKPDRTIRIIVLGGSALYGIGVQDDAFYPLNRTLRNDETITHFLEADLNASLAESKVDWTVEVVNAGVTAYHTFQHVLYVYETLYEYEPDMLLFVDGHNDFYTLSNANPIRGYGYSSVNMVRAFNRRELFLTLHVAARFLGAYSHFFKLGEKASYKLFERYEGRPHNVATGVRGDTEDFEGRLEQAARAGFIRNYRLVAALADYHGFDFHVFLQPEIVFEEEALLSEQDRAIKRVTEDYYKEPMTRLMLRARPQFSGLFRRHGIPFTDIGAIADPSGDPRQLYLDYCHLTPAGSRAVADRMLPILRNYLRERMSAF